MTVIAEAVSEYVRLRRALGFKLTVPARLLPDFAAYAHDVGATAITVALAMDWANTADTPAGVARRLQALRGFARWFSCLDPATEIPPSSLVCLNGHRRRRPYLFSDDDIEGLMVAARALRPPLWAATTETVIGLLAVTGMRIGEVVRLTLDDVDFDQGTLTVWHSKFGKSRLLPLAPSTLDALGAYQHRRRQLAPGATTTTFFVSARGAAFRYDSFRDTFAALATTAGIPSSPWPRPARIHELRHSFTVATVTDWYRQGLDVTAVLPRLSTYLGHLDPAASYWYMTATPELLALAAQRGRHPSDESDQQ